MKDGDMPVIVWVTDDALGCFEPIATDGRMAIFERQRSTIERIASEKYDNKKIQPDDPFL